MLLSVDEEDNARARASCISNRMLLSSTLFFPEACVLHSVLKMENDVCAEVESVYWLVGFDVRALIVVQGLN